MKMKLMHGAAMLVWSIAAGSVVAEAPFLEFAEEDQDRVSGSVKGSRSRVAVKRVE
jgi:hypothetical protein